jgi:hypothetical protein
MSRPARRALVATVAGFALLSLFIFVVPHPMGDAFWIAYGFAAVAFAVQAWIAIRLLSTADSPKSLFLGLSQLQLGAAYVVIQTLLTLAFIFIPVLPAWLCLVLCMGLLALMLFLIFAGMSGAEMVAKKDADIADSTQYMKRLTVDLENVRDSGIDPDVIPEIQSVVDAARFSDPVSGPGTLAVEDRIGTQFAQLRTQTSQGEWDAARESCAELLRLMDERNRECKMNK